MLVAAILLPHLILWAWERPEDLRFADPNKVAVAFLARTVSLRGDEVSVRPRMQPLKVAPGTVMIAVARIEATPGIRDSARQRLETVAAISEMSKLPRLSGIQIDFDARRSERAFYAALLRDLRQRLPAELPLTITALASWCGDDPWLASLPISDAIPMLFRMGPERSRILQRLDSAGDFRVAACRHSLGLSTDEPLTHLPRGRTRYLFHPRPWSPAAVARVLTEEAQ
jgi:hypothetical protein